MPASKFSSSLAIMASVVPEGPSVESYDEARAERIAEARVQQEEEEEEEEDHLHSGEAKPHSVWATEQGQNRSRGLRD